MVLSSMVNGEIQTTSIISDSPDAPVETCTHPVMVAMRFPRRLVVGQTNPETRPSTGADMTHSKKIHGTQ